MNVLDENIIDSQRQGMVLRVSSQGFRLWRLHAARETRLSW